ncbi:MAG: lycopene cyclase domain-containing protein, partial [Rhodoluna sp.]|nr:lycopene cyclase domain-containing protein [Rhodoluna sp.]
MNYLGLNAIFLGALAILTIPVIKQLPWRAIGLATLALLAITAIFDNLIIGLGIVAYDETKISGIMVGLAPIEDFAYSLAAPILISLTMEYI